MHARSGAGNGAFYPTTSSLSPQAALLMPAGNEPRAFSASQSAVPPILGPLARSPVSGSSSANTGAIGFPFLFEGGVGGLGAAMQDAVERSLPPTPRSPSPTCSPPSSPKRKAQNRDEDANTGALSAAEEDLETRAAALGLHEVERRVWRETALPPTPSSPSPTFSPPSSPKTSQRQAELALLTAEQAAVKLAASLHAIRSTTGEGSRSCDSRCDSDSDAMAEAEIASALAACEEARTGSASSSASARVPSASMADLSMPSHGSVFQRTTALGTCKKRQL